MRHDVAGLFWDDTPPPKKVKVKEKCVPPEPVWLAPDYLPGLAEALAYNPPQYTDAELVEAQRAREPLVFDVEAFRNYFLCSFMGYHSGKVVEFEMDDFGELDLRKLRWVFTSFTIVGFNSMHFDVPVVEYALTGADTTQIKKFVDDMIVFGERGGDLLKKMRIKRLRPDHIDLIEVAPLSGSLKAYGGRLHAPHLQDLPFPVDRELTWEQQRIVRRYNIAGDLVDTAFMLRGLWEQVKLRERLGADYGLDLRSKSDAQIAEVVLGSEVSRLNGRTVERPEFVPGLRFQFEVPAFVQYQTPLLNDMLSTVRSCVFEVAESGNIGMPPALDDLSLTIGKSTYQMGMGGLHSSEQRAVHFTDDEYTIYDRDVISYYPRLILNSGKYPAHMGPNFLVAYGRIVSQRVAAKAAGDNVTADALKITANGTFGKTGSPYSILYSPTLLIQVTLSGQLALLMLIEAFELAGMDVLSANTDGIVIKVPNNRKDDYLAIIKWWEQQTSLETEEATYRMLASRDVNNYIAVKPDGKVKAKGAYSNPWGDPKLAIFRFHKNPVNLICTEAVERYVTKGELPVDTVNACEDVRKFITVRSVRGGAVKDGEFLGKTVRWYYANDERGTVVYAKTGQKVPRSDGARPLMALPQTVPEDVNRGWYAAEACSMLAALGLEPPGPTHPPA